MDLIEWYLEGFPIEINGNPRTVGREVEFPIVDERCVAGDIRKIWPEFFTHEEWVELPRDRRVITGFKHQETGIIVTPEAGVCTLELVLPKSRTLQELDALFEIAQKLVFPLVKNVGYRLLGFGTQPITPRSRGLLYPKNSYRALFDVLGEKVEWVTITASDQVHVCISRDEIVDAVNVLNAFSGFIILLMANANIYSGRSRTAPTVRELIWDAFIKDVGLQGRGGMPDKRFEDLAAWVDYVFGQKYIEYSGRRCSIREKKLGELFREGKIDEDLFNFHESTCWWSARPRRRYGTIEVRQACKQPPGEGDLITPLVLGWIANLQNCRTLLERYNWESWRKFRRHTSSIGYGARIHGESAQTILSEALNLSREGLKMRGFGEEARLSPLYGRCKEKYNPSVLAQELWEKGTQHFFRRFSY